MDKRYNVRVIYRSSSSFCAPQLRRESRVKIQSRPRNRPLIKEASVHKLPPPLPGSPCPFFSDPSYPDGATISILRVPAGNYHPRQNLLNSLWSEQRLHGKALGDVYTPPYGKEERIARWSNDRSSRGDRRVVVHSRASTTRYRR